MIGSPNPNLITMLPHFQTLILMLSLFFSSASSLSPSPSANPSPSPSPSQTLMSEPSGILGHHQPQPTKATCEFERIGCHVKGGHPHVRRSGNEELNFGKKLGIVFAAAAILLQVVLGAFLYYKRIQLEKISREGSRFALNSGSS